MANGVRSAYKAARQKQKVCHYPCGRLCGRFSMGMAINMEQSEITPAAIRFAAMNLLAMREHSVKELCHKLSQKYEGSPWVQEVVQRLKTEGLQSDDRFAQAFVSMRKRQGKGPLIISLELKERGIASELVKEYVDPTDEVWHQLALLVRQKKYGASPAGDTKEKAKQMRFLAARGFSAANIQFALKNIAQLPY